MFGNLSPTSVLAGLVANAVADRYGYIGPFVFALLPLFLVAVLALALWTENYGDTSSRLVPIRNYVMACVTCVIGQSRYVTEGT
jgi:hypothetical protein